MDEADLIQQAVRGDNKAFDSLVSPYIRQAHQTAFLLLHDYCLAEDAVQDVSTRRNDSLCAYDRALFCNKEKCLS